MAGEQLLRFLFVLYCATVGIILVLMPWTPRWDQILAYLPPPGLRLLGAPLVRGLLSGFGLLHLVWGIHDFTALLRVETGDEEEQGR